MCAQPSGQYRRGPSENEDSLFNAREVFTKYLYHWPLFLLFIIVALFLAYSYARVDKPVYEVRASLVMQDNKDKQNIDKSALQELDIATPPKIVENEIEVLKSRNLIL